MKKNAPHLTPEEVQTMRDAFAKRRRPGSYEPGKWAVSHYNRDPEILGAAWPDRYPESVILRDITLRVIEQTPGVSITNAQRVRLGEALIEAGIDDIEISAHGWNLSTADLKDQVRHLRSLQPNLKVKMGATQTEAMVDTAAEVGVNLAEFWLPALPEITPIYWSEAYRVAWEGGDWRQLGVPTSLEGAIERANVLTRRIKSHGLRASAGINLLTLVNDEHIERYCKAMAEAEVDEIWLSDGMAGIGPEGWNHIIGLVRQYAPKQQIGIYARNAFGMGVSNGLACVHAGAHVIEVSVNGVSAASGQLDLAQMAVALEIMYGVKTGVRLEKMTSLARLVEDISGVPLAMNHPITGPSVHNWGGTEILIQELKVEPLLHWAFEPELVGAKKEWVVNRTSGMWTLEDKLDEIGVTVPHDKMRAVWQRIVDDQGIRRRTLTDEEIREIAITIGGGS
ncbi:MAG: 2-isopropylmalate synthase [Candidatus Dormibacteraceae bacterium]